MCQRSRAMAVLAVLLVAAGCKQIDLSDQPREGPLEPSRFFVDGQSARTPVSGTIPRGEMRLDEHLYEGVRDGEFAEEYPFELERSDLERGRERYDAFCSPCHGFVGEGDGMIVRRGFPVPPTFHSEHMREKPVGQIYQAIARGAASMPSYRNQIPPDDRWRIVGYVRALQRSQLATREDVPDEQWARLIEADERSGDDGR